MSHLSELQPWLCSHHFVNLQLSVFFPQVLPSAWRSRWMMCWVVSTWARQWWRSTSTTPRPKQLFLGRMVGSCFTYLTTLGCFSQLLPAMTATFAHCCLVKPTKCQVCHLFRVFAHCVDVFFFPMLALILKFSSAQTIYSLVIAECHMFTPALQREKRIVGVLFHHEKQPGKTLWFMRTSFRTFSVCARPNVPPPFLHLTPN